MSVLSPNMSLPVSTIGTDSGLIWEQNLNTSLGLIDAHDHTPGRGVPITPAALNITSDLDFQGHSATNIYGLFFSGSASSSATGALYTAPSSGGGINDLFYNDFAGNVIQITKAGGVDSIASSIPGESYAGGTFTWVQGAVSTTPANFDIGSVTIRPNTAGTTNGVVISANAAIASQYNFVLPLLPVSTSFMAIDSSGNITTPATTASLIPTVAGAPGYFARQNGSGGTLWATKNSTIQVKTANYTLLNTDDVVLCSTNPFTITLPTAVGITGKDFIIKKTDSSLTNIITLATTSSQTIDGATTRTLNTANESYTVYSDGANWQIEDHDIPTTLSATETMVVTSTGTACAIGTTTITFVAGDVDTGLNKVNKTLTGFTNTKAVTFTSSGALPSPLLVATNYYVVRGASSFQIYNDAAHTSIVTLTTTGSGTQTMATAPGGVFWTRRGRYAYCYYELWQLAAGTAGTGDYLTRLPSGLNMDANLLTFNTSATVIGVATTTVGFFSGSSSGASQFTGVGCTPYSATQFRLSGFIGGSPAVWGATNATFSNTTVIVGGWIEVPISGWSD